MDEKGPVIKANGKTLKRMNKETAATLEESDETVPVYVRQISGKTKRHRNSFVKPIVIATIAALLVGTVFSIIMFQLFVHIDQDSANPTLSRINSNDNQKETTGTSENRNPYLLEPIQLFVLQAGVFSEKENANQWAINFDQLGIPTMTWERDQQIYLFAGIAGTKSEAESLKEQLNIDEELDIYIKEWSTTPLEVELTENEIQWLTIFRETIESVVKSGNTISLTAEQFRGLSEIETTETLTPLVEQLNNLEELSGNEARIFLLNLLYKYENLKHA